MFRRLCICLIMAAMMLSGCRQIGRLARRSADPTPTPLAQPTPVPEPLIAYLQNGNLCIMEADGRGQRVLALAPEGESIQDYIWAPDGSRIYFAIGLQLFEAVIGTGNVANAGELTALPGMVIDRMEMGSDGTTLLVNALDADALPRLLAMTVGQSEARELTIDQYQSLLPRRPPTVRTVGEMSVSPDGSRILFKEIVENREELFVSDVLTGARFQLTNLPLLDGFEDSVETEGGRRVMEAAWSPDGRYVVFLPMQSCSETGFCYGRLHLIDSWGGVAVALSTEMMMETPQEWRAGKPVLLYDDGSRIFLVDAAGQRRPLAEGNRPQWQPPAR